MGAPRPLQFRSGAVHRAAVCLLGATLCSLWAVGCADGAASEALQLRRDSLQLASMSARLDSISQPRLVRTASAVRPAPPPLDSAADSLAQSITFLARGQPTFLAAARQRKMLVDIGRVDAPVTTAAERRAFQRAVAALAPVKVGERFRLVGPWGAADARVASFVAWNGRITAVLALPASVSDVVRHRAPLVAFAVRSDSADSLAADSCETDSVQKLLSVRLRAVRDSLQAVLTLRVPALAERLRPSARVRSSQMLGCFGGAHALVVADLSAGGYEHVEEIALLVDDTGHAVPTLLHDSRWKAHDLVQVLDADRDGLSDVAVLGRTQRAGGLSILRYDPRRKRFEFLAGGFAWETM